MDPKALTARAFEIADTCMMAQLEAHALRTEGHPESPLFALAGTDGKEVRSLAEADPALIEALEWLSERGLAELLENEHGESILLTAEALETLAF